MPASFVPLADQLARSAANRATAPGSPAHPRQFTPAFPAPADAPRTASLEPSAPLVSPSSDCGAELPSLDVQRENGQITRIRLRCRCGEVIELECVA